MHLLLHERRVDYLYKRRIIAIKKGLRSKPFFIFLFICKLIVIC